MKFGADGSITLMDNHVPKARPPRTQMGGAPVDEADPMGGGPVGADEDQMQESDYGIGGIERMRRSPRGLQESKLNTRGSAKKSMVQLRRLPDGQFAPKGSGMVLHPGQKVKVPHKSGDGSMVSGLVLTSGNVKLKDGPDVGQTIAVKPAKGLASPGTGEPSAKLTNAWAAYEKKMAQFMTAKGDPTSDKGEVSKLAAQVRAAKWAIKRAGGDPNSKPEGAAAPKGQQAVPFDKQLMTPLQMKKADDKAAKPSGNGIKGGIEYGEVPTPTAKPASNVVSVPDPGFAKASAGIKSGDVDALYKMQDKPYFQAAIEKAELKDLAALYMKAESANAHSMNEKVGPLLDKAGVQYPYVSKSGKLNLGSTASNKAEADEFDAGIDAEVGGSKPKKAKVAGKNMTFDGGANADGSWNATDDATGDKYEVKPSGNGSFLAKKKGAPKIESYDPKTGPSEEQKLANAKAMGKAAGTKIAKAKAKPGGKQGKKPYGNLGPFVVVQDDGKGNLQAVEGAKTVEAARKKAKLYPGKTMVVDNSPAQRRGRTRGTARRSSRSRAAR